MKYPARLSDIHDRKQQPSKLQAEILKNWYSVEYNLIHMRSRKKKAENYFTYEISGSGRGGQCLSYGEANCHRGCPCPSTNLHVLANSDRIDIYQCTKSVQKYGYGLMCGYTFV